VAANEAIKSAKQVKALAVESADLFVNGIGDSLVRYENQIQTAMTSGKNLAATNKYVFEPVTNGANEATTAAQKLREEAEKLHEEWIKFEQNLDKNDKLSGLSGLTRELMENQIAADEALKRFEKLPPALRKEAEARILASKATADARARQKEENEANEDYIELIKQIAAESKMLREAEIEDALFLLDIEVIRGARYNSTMQERLRLSEEFLAIQKSILEKTDSSDVTAYRAQTKAVQDAMKQVIELQKQISDTSPWEGMMRGINSIIDEYENLGSALESTVVKGIKGMEDALVDFVKTGKLEFKDLADAIIADMIRIMVQQSMLSVMKGASGIGGFLSGILGGLGGAAGSAPVGSFNPGMFSNVAHSGGVIGHGGGVYGIYDSSLFDNAPRLHNGLMPDEFPAILQRGERVIPKNQTGGGGAGGDAEIVTNNITINAVDAKSFSDMCKQNPDAIFGPIMSRLKNNKNRTEMKRALT
jgi:lambda family phage tail tape measure protein